MSLKEEASVAKRAPNIHVGMNLLHTRRMDALPPFDTLIAFDATLRHRSMTLAAAELGVTQSAVSHRLRKLERFIGTPLLHRSNSGITATPAGVALAEGLTDLMSGLAALRARCRAAVAPASLRVGVGAALADYWLVRRLPNFTANNPGISIEMVVIENATQAWSLDLDVQVLWTPAAQARATSTQRLLFQEQWTFVFASAASVAYFSRTQPNVQGRRRPPCLHSSLTPRMTRRLRSTAITDSPRCKASHAVCFCRSRVPLAWHGATVRRKSRRPNTPMRIRPG